MYVCIFVCISSILSVIDYIRLFILMHIIIIMYTGTSWCAPRLKDKIFTSDELLESYRIVCMDMRRLAEEKNKII